MIDPNSFAVERTIWACADKIGGVQSGSKSDPIRTGGNIDALRLGGSVRLHLMPGNYTTTGVSVGKVFILDDDDRGGVTITLNPTTVATIPVARMFSDWGNWCSFFSIRGVALDGNYLNQAGSKTGNYKVEPISVQTIIGQVDRVLIRNFGAAAKAYGLIGLECFPLSLTTFASGDKAFYDPRYKSLIELSPSRLEITNCTVEQPHFTDGGYCTGIFVKTSLGIDKGDRQKFGTRSTVAALIKGNRVNTPGGICYGAANVEETVFSNNYATGKCAFNLDTGVADKLSITNNTFENVAQGLNLSPDSGGYRITADGNTFTMGEPFYNTVTKETEAQWGIKAARLGISSANRNTFNLPATWGSTSKVLDGIDGDRNVIQFTSTKPTVVEPSEAEARIKALEAELASVKIEFAAANASVERAMTNIKISNDRVLKLVQLIVSVRNDLAQI